MQDNRSHLTGKIIGGKHVLQDLLADYDDELVFRTELGIARLVRTDVSDAEEQVERWRMAASLSHPNLIRVHEVGKDVLDEMPVFYEITERPDDNLAAVITERPLSTEETRQTIESVAPALEYLHQNGIVHGNVTLRSIVAVGETVKLTVDSLSKPEGDAVEIFSADIASLGAAVVEMLTGRRFDRRVASREIAVLPSPFKEIAAGWLDERIGKQWTLEEGRRRLSDVATPGQTPLTEQPQAAAEAVAEEMPSPAQPKRVSKGGMVAAAAIVLLACIAIAFRGMRSRPATVPATGQEQLSVTRPSPVEPSPEPRAPARTPVRPTPPRSTPAAGAGKVAGERSRVTIQPPAARKESARQSIASPSKDDRSPTWAVIAAIYRDYNAAIKRAQSLSARWSRSKIQVVPPEGQGRRYLVILGSGLTREQAERLRAQATSAGLPQDTYVTKLSLERP